MTMTTRTAERLDDWESRPFTDGYDGLQALAEQSFSGAVRAGRATLYMLNGSVVGIIDGTIEDFDDASGTIYQAPTPALPLLAVMQARGDEVRAKYYSEDTALSEADRKLSEGGFTGFVELSENVLSGDYYVVYHGGKSMSVAYVGESENLITGDEAFEKADEEVGIYKVRPVEVEPIEIPEPEDPPEEPVAASTTGEEQSDDPDEDEETAASTSEAGDRAPAEAADTDSEHRAQDSTAPEPETQPAEPEQPTTDTTPTEASERETRSERQRASPQQPATEETAATQDPDPAPRRESPDDQRPERQAESTDRRERQTGRSQQSQGTQPARGDPRESGDRTSDPRGREGRRSGASEQRRNSTREQESTSHRQGPQHGTRDDYRASDESASTTRSPATPEESDSGSADTSGDLEHRTIPSVDPEKTWTPEDSDATTASAPDRSRTDRSHQRSASQPSSSQSASAHSTPGGPTPTPGQSPASPEPSSTPSREPTPDPTTPQPEQGKQAAEAELQAAESEIEDLQQQLKELETENADLAAERDEIEAERAELESELQRVRSERDDLQTEVEDLREQVSDLTDRLERVGDEAATAETTLRPGEAIDGTNLFVRYASKGEATLKSAHNGSADPEEVNENLNLEYHTQFDTESTAVDGKPYEEFLVNTVHYRFVSWVVQELLYEIRDTGHRDALANLYDALPRIDRAELNATVSVTYSEDGEEQRSQETFDIVLRDRMGNPLVVTNLNDSREAATDDMMTTLVTSARKVGESSEGLAGAFFVTSSFFDPHALETASEATGGGILSRDKRESFVRLSRKDGFHLCLVESRDGDFHLAVPEL